MPSLAELPEIIGFFSYSRDDDEDSHNALSTIRALIQNELRARLGRSRQSLRLWQDQEAIAPGSMWESQINAAVQQSVFFIPIITPRVINSKYCGVEFKRFLDREKELRRDDLVFPILYIDVDELQDETQWRGHSLLEVIGQRQYVDWREYRYELESPALRRAVANLCTKISTALRRQLPNEKTVSDDRAAAQQEAERIARVAEEKRQRDDVAERARIEEEAEERAKAEALRLTQETNRNEEMQRQKRQTEEETPKVKGEGPRDDEPSVGQRKAGMGSTGDVAGPPVGKVAETSPTSFMQQPRSRWAMIFGVAIIIVAAIAYIGAMLLQQPASVDAGSQCRTVVGSWTWKFLDQTEIVVFKADGTGSATNGNTSTWTCGGRTVVINWRQGQVDTMTLSSDGKRMTGTGWRGISVLGIRM